MSFDRRDTFIMRSGAPGAGKSWSVTRYVVDDWLPNHAGPVYTNLPLNVSAIRAYVQRRYRLSDAKADEMVARIHLFPQKYVGQWLDGEGTPAAYFAELEAAKLDELEEFERAELLADLPEGQRPSLGILGGALVVLDEAGKMWPNTTEDPSRKACVAEFVKWLRTLRHEGCRLVFLVQDEKQLNASIRRLVTVHLQVLKLDSRREPVTGAMFSDWLQAWAFVFRFYTSWIRESEFVKDGAETWVEDHSYATPLWAKYFPLYDSHNREGAGHGGAEEEFEWQRFSSRNPFKLFGALRFALWLIGRNAINWGWRFTLGVVLWLLVGPPFWFGFVGFKWARVQVQLLFAGKRAVATGELGGQQVTPQIAGKSSKGKGSPVDQLQQDLLAERARRSELEQRLGAASGIVVVHDKGAVTDDGDYWEVGQPIEFGFYRGQVVESVDVHRGRVRLVNGVVLRLRRQADSANANASGPVVAGALPRGGTNDGAQTGRGSSGRFGGELERGIRHGAGGAPSSEQRGQRVDSLRSGDSGA